MIADVIPSTTRTKIPVSSQTQDLQVGLRPVIKHMKTENHSPPGSLDSHTSTIATHATWYSDDPLPDDGAASVVRVDTVHHQKDLCILDSGANRVVFNNDSWLEPR